MTKKKSARPYHPRVFEWTNDFGEQVWPTAQSIDTPTHKVVPLGSLVIERDENGEWPEWAMEALRSRRSTNPAHESQYRAEAWAFTKNALDALAEGETP